MSKLVKDINNKALYESLNQSLEADKLYWTQNDAKIRASYTSRNYDEFRYVLLPLGKFLNQYMCMFLFFREIVAAAHLQPVQSKDIRARKVIWNSFSKYNDVNE